MGGVPPTPVLPPASRLAHHQALDRVLLRDRGQFVDDRARQRDEGYLRAPGLPHPPGARQAVTALHRADGARAMAALLDGPEPPDAVFAFCDELALGALHVAHACGVRVPGELAIVGFDDIEDGRYSHPPLTTVAPDKHQIAQRSLQCLADRIRSPGNTVPPQELTVPHRLVRRATA